MSCPQSNRWEVTHSLFDVTFRSVLLNADIGVCADFNSRCNKFKFGASDENRTRVLSLRSRRSSDSGNCVNVSRN
jgi:hypothetical protein